MAFGLMFILGVCAAGAGMVWIAERSALAPRLHRCSGIVAPYIGLMGLMFSLFVVFMVGDMWTHREKAQAAVTRESDALRTLGSIAAGLGERGRKLEALVSEYATAASAEDWQSVTSLAATERLSRRLIEEGLFGGPAQAGGQMQRSAVEAANDVRASRRDRLTVAQSETRSNKWLAALVLGLLTQMALVVVHFGNLRASMLAMVLFSFAMGFVLWVTLVRIDPFAGREAVSLQPIREAAAQSR